MKNLIAISLLFTLVACDNSSSSRRPTPAPEPDPTLRFELTVTNLTAAQPFSPAAVIIHDQAVTLFEIGNAASAGLELLAESGDNSQLLQETTTVTSVSAEQPLAPGASETLDIAFDSSDTSGLRLSFVSMLVNTNDAITAVMNIDVDTMTAGESRSFTSISYDSGTEANTETDLTIPGPAGGGEGFNAARDDIRDQVTAHPGVVGVADGLEDSALTAMHRWDNPVARVTLTRIQ